MTLDKLKEMTIGQILHYIKDLERKQLILKRNIRRRYQKQRAIDEAARTEVMRGNVIPLYYRDEFTGLHYRAERPAQWVLMNDPEGAA